jgi:hypothetical protein
MAIENIEAERLRKTFLRICGETPASDKNNFSNDK